MSNAANTVRLNGQDYQLLPLNWKQLKERKSDIVTINGLDPRKGMFSDDEQDAILRVVTASLQRTRNDIKEEFVQEHLDLGNVGDMLKMVFGQKVQTPSPQPGEAQAATSAS